MLKKIERLKDECILSEKKLAVHINEAHPFHKESILNLIHYMAIRSHDIRHLQTELSDLAISSQAHSEGYVMNNIQKTEFLIRMLLGKDSEAIVYNKLDLNRSKLILKRKSERLFGKSNSTGETFIMVTLPSESADDYDIIYELVGSGMRIARINTAHDSLDVWKRMISNVKKASKSQRKNVKVYMDLAGPKIRTMIKSDKDKGILLKESDILRIINDHALTNDAKTIGISIPEIMKQIRTGERVIFDDGKIFTVVKKKLKNGIELQVTYSAKGSAYLKNQKGVNLPDSTLTIPSLTKEDIDMLPFIVENADMLGYSFVRKPADVDELQKRLTALGKNDFGLILKIETVEAFSNLPMLVTKAMRSPNIGLMIARGDLAVEMGFRRMAEVQEEMLWLAEAAHIPLIWATQVFENLVGKGMPSRAEISDAVKSVRAECVMLNKGPFINDAIRVLKDIDKRMSAHEEKKVKRLRSLSIARDFLEMHHQ